MTEKEKLFRVIRYLLIAVIFFLFLPLIIGIIVVSLAWFGVFDKPKEPAQSPSISKSVPVKKQNAIKKFKEKK